MKKIILLACLLGSSIIGNAQIQGNGGTPYSEKAKYIIDPTIAISKFPTPNIQALRAEDEIVDEYKSGPWRFAYNHLTNLNMSNSGTWTDLKNGGKMWRIHINSKDALTLNFFLKDVVIPEGNGLYVYNLDKSFILGEFVQNHVYLGELGTELIPGQDAILEYYVSPTNTYKPHSLTIDMIGHGYRTAEEYREKAFGSSGSCNMNVVCPDGTPWENQIRSVAMLVSGSVNGSGFCTGALINNVNNDGKPYFLTANHCGTSVTNWIFRFNWQSATCNNPNASPTNFNSLSGATLRATRANSDFNLVEITGGLTNGRIPSNFNVYFPGWNRRQTGHTAAIGIHHPAGDIKKISFDDNAPTISNYGQTNYGDNTWRVVWDRNTTTEGGSSGSPLFNQNGQIIGQLWGGGAACNRLTQPDYYGGLWMSWDAVANTAQQLKFWLDPNNTGVEFIDGYEPNTPAAPNNAGISAITSPAQNALLCTNTVTPVVVLRNSGSNNLTSVAIVTSANGTTLNTYNWTGNLASNASTNVTLPQMTLPNGNVTIAIRTNNPNGQTDTNTANDNTSTNVTVVQNGNPVTINILTDCYGEETRWAIQPNNSSTITIQGGNTTVPLTGGNTGYSQNHSSIYQDNTQYAINTCLTTGCYTFTIADAYRDGIGTSQYCNRPGSYSVTDGGSTNLVTMTTASFGAAATHNFCVGGATNVSTSSILLSQLAIYPNPSNGLVTIKLDDQFINSTIDVLDITGRIVYTETLNNSEQSFDLSNLTKGRYLVNIQTHEGNVTKTIVLQ